MGYQLASGVTNPNTGESLTGAYLKISTTQIDHSAGSAQIETAIYVSKAAREAGNDPIFEQPAIIAGAEYTAAIGGAPATSATTVADITVSSIYTYLPKVPALATLLAGATQA
jgi:hypothetical protein